MHRCSTPQSRKGVRATVTAMALALSLGAAASAHAQAPAGAGNPAQFVTGLGNRVIQLITDQQQPAAQRRAAFVQLVNRSFDVDGIARFVLGPYWRTATPAQRQQFEQVFDTYMIDVYWSRFSQYGGQTLSVTGESPAGAGTVVVSSAITQPQGRPIGVDWRVSDHDGHYQITDVSVAGISELITYRQEFADEISSDGGNVDALINQLRAKNQQIGG